MRHGRWALVSACAVMGAMGISCRDATDPRPVPAALEIVSGGDQQGVVATTLPAPLVARVRDPDGQPVRGQLVRFRVTAGGGSVSVASGSTNENGLVESRWTLGTSTADVSSVEAQVVGESADMPPVVTVFHATTLPDLPDTVRAVSGDGQSALTRHSVPDSLLARVVDRFGNPVPGIPVAWSVSADGGTLSRSADVTTATGITSTRMDAGLRAGDASVVATVGGRSATFTVHVSRAPLTIGDLVGEHVLRSFRGQGIPASFSPSDCRSVQIISGSLVIRADGTGVLTETSSTTIFLAGTDSSSVSLTGTVTLNGDSLTLLGLKGVVSDTAITLDGYVGASTGARGYDRAPQPGAGVSLERVSGDDQRGTVGAPLANPVVVRIRDAAGNPVRGQEVGFNVEFGGGTLAAARVLTDADGLAKERWTLGTGTGDQYLTVLMTSNASGVAERKLSIHAIAAGDVPANVTIDGGTVRRAYMGFSFPVLMDVTDQFGNHLAVVPTIAINPSDAIVLESAAVGDHYGAPQVQMHFHPSQVGDATITFTAGSATTRLQVTVTP